MAALWVHRVLQKSRLPFGTMPRFGADLAGGSGRAGRSDAIAGRAEQHVANGRARIAPQLRLRQSRLLKIELIELRSSPVRGIRLVGGALPRGRNGTLSAATALKRSGRVSAACEATLAPQSCPTMTAVAAPRASRIADHVADKMQDGVLVDRLRRVALAVAAHIGGDNTEAGGSKRIDLMPPREPGFRKAVHQQHQRPRPARRC
jgi:hypothetical protein